MSEDFDPYRKWLGIPPKDQPPNHYRLLGIPHFEDDPDVIENAATRQMVHIRTYQSGKYSAASQKILNELTAAKLCLLQPDRKREYDFTLRQELEAAGKLSSEAPLEAGDDAPGIPPPPPADFRSSQGGRWRTSPENTATGSSPELAPVPIPMPPLGTAVPSGTAGPVVGVQSRRPNYANIRSRRKSSGMPVLLILCSLALLALGGIVAVIIATQEPAPTPPQVKPPKPEHATPPPDRSITKKPAPTPFPVGSNQRPPPKTIDSNKPLPISSRNPTGGEPAPEAVVQDPRAELTKARQALEHRDDGNFRLHISQAEYLRAQNKPADAELLQAEETHLRDVEKLLNNFWQAVREGADKKIPKGEKISFKRHKLEIVSREGDQLTYKFDDVENTVAIKKLPARVAMYMALRVFGQDNLDGKLAIVVFQLIDSEAARDPASQRLGARLLEDIEKAGVSENPVLTRERAKAARPPADQQQELSGPLILGVTPPDKLFEPKFGAAVKADPSAPASRRL